MSDVQLPPDGEIVLAWWDGVAYFAQLRRGKWIRLDVDGVERVEIAPELWVPLSHAKAATRRWFSQAEIDAHVNKIVSRAEAERDKWASTLAGIDDPAAFLREVREVLEGVEWNDGTIDRPTCPWCKGLKEHTTQCRLAALLAKMKGVPNA